jgi:hypothetical protein
MRNYRPVRNRVWLRLVASIALLFSMGLSVRLGAQVVGATLSGAITDESGAVLPGSQVAIKNSATGITRTVSTNSVGVYSAPNLIPGDYMVTISSLGFAAETTNVTLTVGIEQVLNLTMRIGKVTENVQVTSEAPTVNLADAAIGAVNNETTVRELPLNGRSWTDLATLQPGVYQLHTQFTNPRDLWSRGIGDQLTISGARPQQNNYRLDGISINDPTNGGPGNMLGGNFGVDAIREFSVLTTNYSTEYGRASGGIINATTKSGTNQFHGDAYEFLRNWALDAATFWDNQAGLKTSQLRQNQFGGSAGGPIKKDKTFIFGDYEGLRRSEPLGQSASVPSANARLGILTGYSGPVLPPGPCADPNGTNLAPGSANICVDSSAAKFVNAFYPKATSTPAGSDTGTFPISRPTITNENYYIFRVDQNFSEKDRLSGTYFRDYSNQSAVDGMGNLSLLSDVNRQFATVEEVHTFGGALVNSARLGYHRTHLGGPSGAVAINPAVADTSLGFAPGQSAGWVIVTGLTQFLGGLTGAGPQTNAWNSWQAYDDASLLKGKHTLKFGGNVERIDANMLASPRPGGQFSYGTIAGFLSNGYAPNSGSNSISSDLPGPTFIGHQYYRQTIAGAYIQDDWRFRPNLTFNIGLRYEPATVPTLRYGRFDNLLSMTDPFPHVPNPATANCGTSACPALSGGIFHNNMLRDFDPRVGFAWDPFRNGKTSVRGGFGVYDQLTLISFLRTPQSGNYPFETSGNVGTLLPGSFSLNGNPLPTSWLNQLGPIGSPTGNRAGYIEPNPGRAYAMQWNLSFQREIMPNLTALIGYVGSHGVHGITYDDDGAMVLPISSPLGYLWPCEAPGFPYVASVGNASGCFGGTGPGGSGDPFKKPNPNFGRINTTLFRNSSVYHGLELQITKRMSHGFQVQGSFTWQKNLDTADGQGTSDQYLTSVSSLFIFDPKLSRARSEFNSDRVFSINYLWDIPAPKSLPSFAGGFLGGWQLGGVFSANAGAPFTPVLNFDDVLGQRNTDPWAFPDRVAGCNPVNSNFKHPGAGVAPLQYVNVSCFTVPPIVTFNGTHYIRMGNGGRNTIIGPGLQNLDFSLVKNTSVTKLSESFKVQFRAEFFNVLNRANFNPIGEFSTYGVVLEGLTANPAFGGAGTLQSADVLATPSREIQLALKIIW